MSIYLLTRKVKNGVSLSSKMMFAILLSFTIIQNVHAYTKPRFSSVVIDVNTGRTLQATNATSPRYPASLTKIMTLYMLFEELKAGRVKKWTRLPVSSFATRQEPSKLNLKKGSWITVDDAIKALVTKSANDVAVVIAEYIGGTERRFATKMTKKARAIGMKKTTFKNASGLPNKGQLTTAKDMAILGIQIQKRFPTYYKYFKTRSFKYKGRVYGNHNKLLGRYDGVDGIKTGYTRASGFNLVSSVKRNGKSVVAVVIGSRTGNVRNAKMKSLLNKAMPRLIAMKSKPKTYRKPALKVAPKPKKPTIFVAAQPVLAKFNKPSVKPRLTARMTPMPKTLSPAKTKGAVNAPKPIHVASNGKVQKDESRVNFAAANGRSFLPLGYAPTVRRTNKGGLSTQGRKIIAIVSEKYRTKNKTKPASIAQPVLVASNNFKDDWAVQVGAYANPIDAKKHLDTLSKIMSPYDAKYYIPSVKKGSKSIYRARFADLSKQYARRACSAIKRKGYSCLALRNN